MFYKSFWLINLINKILCQNIIFINLINIINFIIIIIQFIYLRWDFWEILNTAPRICDFCLLVVAAEWKIPGLFVATPEWKIPVSEGRTTRQREQHWNRFDVVTWVRARTWQVWAGSFEGSALGSGRDSMPWRCSANEWLDFASINPFAVETA